MSGLVVLAGNYAFVILMMFVGLCYGGFMSMIASITADVFGAKHLPINFGIMFLAYGIAAFVGPRMAAVVKMINNGDYSLAFMIATAFCGVGLLLNLIAMKKIQKMKQLAS